MKIIQSRQDYNNSMNRQQIDMTHGPLTSKILFYAIPLAITAILQQLFNAADVAIVGQFAGTDAMAAVGANSSLISFFVNLFVGISLGTNVVIAHAIGREEKEDIHKAVHTSIYIALFGGLFMLILGEIIAPKILSMMSVPDSIFSLALRYLRIYLAGMPVIFLYNFESAIYRGQGNTRTPLIALTIGGLLNVLLNLFCVLILKMSVEGVALATVVSNLISSSILFMTLVHSTEEIRIRFDELKVDKDILVRILKIGLPSGIQSSVFSVANIIVQSAINSLGAIVIAASSAAFNLEIFAYYVMNSFGQACTTFVGQNFGAGKMDRCRKTLYSSFLLAVLFTFLSIVFILFFGKNLLAFFNSDKEVIEYGYQRLMIIFFAYIFSVWQEIGSGYLRGFGLSLWPALLSLVGICGIRIFWIFFVFPKYPTFITILLVFPISLCAVAVAIVLAILILKPSKRA